MSPNDHQQTVEVNVPVRVAYNQWTQFEKFPVFMEGVESVTQITDDLLRWKVDIAGVEREFDTRITEQSPDQRIAWETFDGPRHAGVVTFHRIDDETTRVTLQMDYDPDGFLEHVGDKLGFVANQLDHDMNRFKQFIEDREVATGAWRGSIEQS